MLDRQGRDRRPRRRRAAPACSRRRAPRAPCWSPPTSRTTRAFQRVQGHGFTYFQGDYFAKPRLFRHRGVATAGLGSLRQLVGADRRRRLLRGPRADHLVRRRPVAEAAALRQLRLLRAAAHRVARCARRSALLGVRTVRRWATVMAISAIPDVPDELVALGLRRARMCEMLAGSALPEERETLFTIGLFSVADALHRRADGRGARLAAVHRRDPGGAAAPRGSRRASCCRPSPRTSAASSRRCRRADAGVSLAGAYRAALEWADDAGRAIA